MFSPPKILSNYTAYTIYKTSLLAPQYLKSHVFSCGSSSLKQGQKGAFPGAMHRPAIPRAAHQHSPSQASQQLTNTAFHHGAKSSGRSEETGCDHSSALL